MLKYNLSLFLRNIKKNKVAFLINIFGLGVGIASFLVLFLYVYNDLSYNHFHENLSNIYRVREGETMQTRGLLLPEILKQIPEIENGTRIFDWGEFRVSYEDKAFLETVHYADTGFFSIFSFPFLENSTRNPIQDKYSVVISKEFAEKYFGNTSALGKQLKIDFDEVYLTVNGVVDIPENSSINFDIITSYETGEEISPWVKDIHDWYNVFSNTYILLKKGTNPQNTEHKLQSIAQKNFLPAGNDKAKLNLLNFETYHSIEESNQMLIIILGIMALSIIGVAVVNFINLTTTNTLSRAKEIGVKRVHGATKYHLFYQVITESSVVSLIALFLAMSLVLILLPTFNLLFETNLNFNPIKNVILIPMLIIIWLVISILSGLIPYVFWAKSKLIQSLRGNLFSKTKVPNSRYSSIIVQFSLAVILISGTLLIRKQISHMMGKDPKFDNENVIVIQLDSWQYKDLDKISKNFQLISDELESNTYVESVSFSQNVPGVYSENYNTFYFEGDKKLGLRKAYVEKNYFKTFDIKFLSDVGIDKDLISRTNYTVLNKTAMDEFGLFKAERQILREGSESGEVYQIIGFTDDFSYQGAQKEIQPLAHFITEFENLTDWNFLAIRAVKGSSFQVIDLIEKKWQEQLPGSTLNYFFSDEKLNDSYKEYIKMNKLITLFSILAVILSCMGLFALSAYIMARKTKEIGIRKTNGATISQIVIMLNKDFLKWVLIAFVTACPISYYVMTKWLENFAYKTSFSWWIFALSGIIVICVALLTVSWWSIKGANINPVEALREE